MEIVTRNIEQFILKYLFRKKAIIIYGARQTGKTTVLKKVLSGINRKILFLNGDDTEVRETFLNPSASRFRPVIADNEIVVIDEAQRIAEPGLVMKIIHDNFTDVQLIATGSSAFELASGISEPMTGRKIELYLHPFSFDELVAHNNYITEKGLLQHRLIYGCYPEIALSKGEETMLLKSLASDYLYKDILTIEQIRKPALIEKLLKAIAFQMGNEVSYLELAQITGSDKNTVEKYIDILEKAWIIFKLPSFSRNARNEIRKGKKIYFYDNGIRNSIIGNFTPLASRSDSVALWENFLVSERIKYLSGSLIDATGYFWRSTQQNEIDYLEEIDGNLSAYEFKWNPSRKYFFPKTFKEAYPEASLDVITKDNIDTFLLKKI